MTRTPDADRARRVSAERLARMVASLRGVLARNQVADVPEPYAAGGSLEAALALDLTDARAENAELRRVLHKFEFANAGDCIACGRPDGGHYGDCEIERTLAAPPAAPEPTPSKEPK